MKLYLVRHAQTEANIGKHDGKETILTSTGKEQAQRLGKYFSRRKIDKTYCSKLIRAQDTLQAILPHLKKKNISYTKTINERSYGTLENVSRKKFYDTARKAKKKPWQYRPPRGENLADVEERAQKVLDVLKKKHAKETVLLVSHGTFLRTLICRAFKHHIREVQYFELHNASISILEFNKKGGVIHSHIDDHNHLLKYSSYTRERFEQPSLQKK